MLTSLVLLPGPAVLRHHFGCPFCQAPEVSGDSSSHFLTGSVFVAPRWKAGEEGWVLPLGQGGMCVLLQEAPGWSLILKLILLSLCFVFPALFVLSQLRGGSLQGDTRVVTVQLDSLCSRVALYKVTEVSQVASFLPGTLGSSASVLLFTQCLFCRTRVYYKCRVRICTFLKSFCVLLCGCS